MNEHLCAGVGDGSEQADAPTQPVRPETIIPEVETDIADLDESVGPKDTMG